MGPATQGGAGKLACPHPKPNFTANAVMQAAMLPGQV